jgi:hypothetical protein
MEVEKIVSRDRIKRPFESGGVAGDTQRKITGSFGHNVTANTAGSISNGAFSSESVASIASTAGQIAASMPTKFNMDTAKVVPVGEENAPRNLSVNYWRRVS